MGGDGAAGNARETLRRAARSVRVPAFKRNCRNLAIAWRQAAYRYRLAWRRPGLAQQVGGFTAAARVQQASLPSSCMRHQQLKGQERLMGWPAHRPLQQHDGGLEHVPCLFTYKLLAAALRRPLAALAAALYMQAGDAPALEDRTTSRRRGGGPAPAVMHLACCCYWRCWRRHRAHPAQQLLQLV